MNDRVPLNLISQECRGGCSRRDFLKIGAAVAGAAALPSIAGCGPVRTGDDCLKDILSAPNSRSPKAFEGSSIGNIRLKNRIIRSAVTMNGIDSHGRPKDTLLAHYADIAGGGAGAIITGMIDTGMMMDDFRYKDEYFKDYKKVPDTIHRYNTPVIQQLSHRGGQASLAMMEKSFINGLSESDIEDIIRLFVRAIGISRRLGFDAVQLHGAHGYLLAGFLSSARNERSDRWGGSLENRFRIIREISKRSAKNEKGFPLWIKINGYDNQKNGMRVEEAAGIARMAEEAGIASIEVSCGGSGDGFSTVRVTSIPTEAILEFTDYKKKSSLFKFVMPALAPFMVKRYEPLENYNVCAAAEISRNVKIPVAVVGGIRKIDDINAILASGAAGYVSMARPFIIEPDIVNRFREEAHAKSECINCGFCLVSAASTDVRCFYGKV